MLHPVQLEAEGPKQVLQLELHGKHPGSNLAEFPYYP